MALAAEVRVAPRRSLSWTRLGKGDTAAESEARGEALELARALALQTVVDARDAVVEELSARQRAIEETIWPASPIAGYGLHSSLGAYLVTRVAVAWAASGPTSLRHEPLDRHGLIAQLGEHAVDKALAMAAIGDFRRVERGFQADPAGLDVSRIAGLAEGSLSRGERIRALSQVAFSSRCLARLASALSVLSATRNVLSVIGPEAVGADLSLGLAALALGRPDRVGALLGPRPDALGARTVAEVAEAILRLEQGEAPQLEDDGPIMMPGLEASDGTRSSWSEALGQGAPERPPESEDDVLEIVEERIERPAASFSTEDDAGGRARPARWWTSQEAPTDIDDAQLIEWGRLYEDGVGMVARRQGLLGLRPAVPARTAAALRCPPDERLVRRVLAAQHLEPPGAGPQADESTGPLPHALFEQGMRLTGTAHDALFPPVRGALRAIVRAAEGATPTGDALKHAGDLGWVLRRCRALALAVRGELEAAVEAVRDMPGGASPEAQWAKDRILRFGGRRPVRATVEEARVVAAGLVLDLVMQLGRTIAGTVPRSTGMDRAV